MLNKICLKMLKTRIKAKSFNTYSVRPVRVRVGRMTRAARIVTAGVSDFGFHLAIKIQILFCSGAA